MPQSVARANKQDDFYLNLVSWSSSNVLGVGLSNSVYLWSAQTSRVDKLCDMGPDEGEVTGLEWTNKVSLFIPGAVVTIADN